MLRIEIENRIKNVKEWSITNPYIDSLTVINDYEDDDSNPVENVIEVIVDENISEGERLELITTLNKVDLCLMNTQFGIDYEDGDEVKYMDIYYFKVV